MDQSRFDDLARALGGAGATRRAGLKAALGGLLGLLALPGTDGEAKKKKKKRSAACVGYCPSGQACRGGQCTCTRPACGDACCAGNQTCIDGQCTETGLRDCSGVAIDDGADLSYCNLSRTTIKAQVLQGVNFEGADLTLASLANYFQPRQCNFTGATMVNAVLKECDIKPGTIFAGADLTYAKIMDGHIDGADFSGAILTGANLHSTKVSNTRFDSANLTDVNLINTKLDRCTFPRAVFRNADLFISTITNCGLSGANLDRASLVGADFQDSAMDDASLAGAEIGWASTRQGDAYHTKFTRCSMRGATMTGQIYKSYYSKPGVTFVDVDLGRASFGASYPRDLVGWLRTDLTGASGWQEPAGGYAFRCSTTLPSGAPAQDATWYEIDWGTIWDSVDPVPCSQAPAKGAPVA